MAASSKQWVPFFLFKSVTVKHPSLVSDVALGLPLENPSGGLQTSRLGTQDHFDRALAD